MTKYNLRRIVPLLILMVVYCYSARTQPVIEHVNSKAMKKAMESESNVVVLDVRQPGEMVEGKIPGAENIDIKQDEFWLKFKALSKEKKYFVYSSDGGLSTSAARVMKQMGFQNVYNLLGGFEAWKSAGYFVE
ncbi:MAG: rhodanese-like domain-containing protein [Cytophagales bacterium]|nr:rhodanese-like domain-containing protein [Cytophagales bacterium]